MRIFGPERFAEDQRQAVEALWEWYDLAGSAAATLEDAQRLRAGSRPTHIPSRPWEAVSRELKSLGVDPLPLVGRLEATARLQTGKGPESGAAISGTAHDLGGGFGEVLARLAGHKGSWQRRAASEFAQGLVLTDFLYHVPEYASRRMSLFSQTELSNAGIRVADLVETKPDGYERMAWKQSIRARDALAASRVLIADMPFRERLYAKKVWFTTLEVLHALDQVEFDVWDRRPEIGALTRFRVAIQSIFGKTAFQSA